jgi:hypothetical protein
LPHLPTIQPTLTTTQPTVIAYLSTKEHIEERAAALAAALSLTRPELAALTMRQPTLFSSQADSVARNLREVAEALGMSEADFRSAALRREMLLFFTRERMRHVLSTAPALLGRSEGFVRDMVLNTPSSMAQRPEHLARKHRVLAAAAGSHAAWAEGMAAMGPTMLATLLGFGADRMARLLYAVEVGLQPHMTMPTLMQFSRLNMGERFPGYGPWAEGRPPPASWPALEAALHAAVAAAAEQPPPPLDPSLMPKPGPKRGLRKKAADDDV